MTTETSLDDETWKSLTEQTILLQDGLKYVAHLVSPPESPSKLSSFIDLIDCNSEFRFEPSWLAKLSQSLQSTFSVEHSQYHLFFDLRQRSITSLWQVQQKCLDCSRNALIANGETSKPSSEQNATASFTSHISLLLLLPLLQSQARTDPSLAASCTSLLLNCLKECGPNSLSAEPANCINGLEDLLCSWIGSDTEKQPPSTDSTANISKEDIITTLIALACGRLSIRSFIQVLSILMKHRTSLLNIAAGNVLRNALKYIMTGKYTKPALLRTSHFVTQWPCNPFPDSVKNDENCPSISCNGKYLFVTSATGKGLAKIGTGQFGSFRGFVYSTNLYMEDGWVAWNTGNLLFRPKAFDDDSTIFCHVLDPSSLQIKDAIEFKEAFTMPSKEPSSKTRTILFTSDGVHLYWVFTLLDATTKQTQRTAQQNQEPADFDLYVWELKLEMKVKKRDENNTMSKYTAVPVHPPVTINFNKSNKKDKPLSQTDTSKLTVQQPCDMVLTQDNLHQTPMFISSNMLVIVSPHCSTSDPKVLTFRSKKNPTNCCFSLFDGQSVSKDCVIDTEGDVWQDFVLPKLGICCDSFNGVMWTYGHGKIHEWRNSGYLGLNQVLDQLGVIDGSFDLSDTNNIISPVDIISCVTIHISILCTTLDAQLSASHTTSNEQLLDCSCFKLICEVLHLAIVSRYYSTIICLLQALQPLLKLTVSKGIKLDQQLVKDMRSIVWMLVCCDMKNIHRELVQKEACTAFVCGLVVFYPESKEQSALLMVLLSDEESDGVLMMREMILCELAEQLGTPKLLKDVPTKLAYDAVWKLINTCEMESTRDILMCGSLTDEEFFKFTATQPFTSSALNYISSLVLKTWRDLMLDEHMHGSRLVEMSEFVSKNIESIMLAIKILETCQKLFEDVCQVLGKLQDRENDLLTLRLKGLEKVIKATPIGQVLVFLVTILTHQTFCTLPVAIGLLAKVTSTTVAATRSAKLFCNIQALTNQNGEETGTNDSDQSLMSSLPDLALWTRSCRVESIHPIRDEYKLTKTVTFKGATCVYLKFDPRCATQYEYDKVLVYAGTSSSGRKLGEHGGNSYGYGSKGVIRLGWPKDVIVVEGESVTLCFQVKSTRERNTPDRAVWGFACTVSLKREEDERDASVPILVDVALGLSYLNYKLLNVMYNGPLSISEEDTCKHLLNSQLLQRCVWENTKTNPLEEPEACGITFTVTPDQDNTPTTPLPQPRQKLSRGLMKRLRNTSGILAPTLRPSIQQALQPDAIEEVILSAVIRHLNLSDMVKGLEILQVVEFESGKYVKFWETMRDVFRRLDGILRQLQAMAEVELRWSQEIDDIRQGLLQPSAGFFNEYHLQEVKSKDLELLCNLKEITFDPIEQEQVVGKLIELLEHDAKGNAVEYDSKDLLSRMPKTTAFRYSLLECGELLCSVTIKNDSQTDVPERSISQCTFGAMNLDNTHRTSEDKTALFYRSLSAPPHLHHSFSVQEGAKDLRRLQRWRTAIQKKNKSHSLAPLPERRMGKVDHDSIVDDIFAFIGSDPENATSCCSFLTAARIRNDRGSFRIKALLFMRELVDLCSGMTGDVSNLLHTVASILSQGPRIEELKCGGLVETVREEFNNVTQSLLQQTSSNPVLYSHSIITLSVCPFSWQEERCVIRSGLIALLDKLCVLGCDTIKLSHNLSSMAWASFQVLLDRFVQWEKDQDYHAGAIEWSGLAYQVSSLITNYLNTVLQQSRRNNLQNRDTLQHILKLLQSIAKSKMGEAILHQPCIVSTLLAVLLDHQSPPKLVLAVLRLCHVALPLMTENTCEQLTLPDTVERYLDSTNMKPVRKVAKLLLMKLGDLVLPSTQTEKNGKGGRDGGTKAASSQDKDEQYSVYVHKRTDQPAHEIVQKLMSSVGQQSNSSGEEDIDCAVRFDQELTQTNKVKVLTNVLSTCETKASNLASLGLVTSVVSVIQEPIASQNEKKLASIQDVCSLRNRQLASESCRPFVSGQVALTMAAEVISLLQRLLLSSSSETTTNPWSTAIRCVILDALITVPAVMERLSVDIESSIQYLLDAESTDASQDDVPAKQADLMTMSRRVMAALCVIGGFKQSVYVGCKAKIIGEDMEPNTCEVTNICESLGTACVTLENSGGEHGHSTLGVPLARLELISKQIVFVDKLVLIENTLEALHLVLKTRDVTLPEPNASRDSSIVLMRTSSARILCEMKTRASMVLASQMNSPSFCNVCICHHSHPLHTIKHLANESNPGQRLSVLESQCQELRKLFKDLVKPADSGPSGKAKDVVFDITREFPPLQGVVLSEGNKVAHLVCEGAHPQNLPRGAYMYCTASIPVKAPSYYWEVEVISMGDTDDTYVTSGSSLSIGLVPAVNHSTDKWSSPVDACLLHDNGIAVHYKRGGFTSWETISTGIVAKTNHVIGCGYTRSEEDIDKGTVYFTHNGQRLQGSLNNVKAGLWPLVHLHKKDVKVRVNFGSHAFVYAQGSKIRRAADLVSDSMEELRDMLQELPFAELEQDTDEEPKEHAVPCTQDSQSNTKTIPEPLDLVSTTEFREYDPCTSLTYMLLSSCDVMTDTGPSSQLQEDEHQDESLDHKTANLTELLVKAWEDKVFPVIRRRFRNEADRRSGLEQIRGALQAGLMDIAVATLEDLYEDSGGIPNTLTLPRLEDVKEDANKLTISKIRQGMGVAISTSLVVDQSMPGFAVPEMKKTSGLNGIVLSVDKLNKLVEVETYNREEGNLMRFWYPVNFLEKPASELGRSSFLAMRSEDTTQIDAQEELLKCEKEITRLYCRAALIEALKSSHSSGDDDDALTLVKTLSSHLLLAPYSNGSTTPTSLPTVSTPGNCLSLAQLLPSSIFYSKPQAIFSEMHQLLSKAKLVGDDELIKLTSTVCQGLRDPLQSIWHREFVVSHENLEEEVHFNDAAVTIVTCRVNPAVHDGWVNIKKPLVSVLCYYGGPVLSKSGRKARYKALQYPMVATDDTDNQADQLWIHKYPCKVLPTNRVVVRYESKAVEGPIVDLHGFSCDILLALVYIECFVERLSNNWRAKLEEGFSRSVVFNVIETLSVFVLKTNLPPVVKEIVFHLLAQLLRVNHELETMASAVPSQASTTQLTLILTRLGPLKTELQKLLDKEISVTSVSALEFILKGDFENDKFTSYLQALFEVVQAMAEVAPWIRERSGSSKRNRGGSLTDALLQGDFAEVQGESIISPLNFTFASFDFKSDSETPSTSPLTSPIAMVPHIPPSSSRPRRRGSLRKRKRAHVQEVLSPTESMPWFDTVITLSLLLRHLLQGNGDPRGVAALLDSLSAVVSIKPSSVIQRLLVLTNIPQTLTKQDAIDAIKKACKPSGGIYEERTYLPEIALDTGVEQKEQKETGEHWESYLQLLPSAKASKTRLIRGHAVIELRNSGQVDLARQAICAVKSLRESGQESSQVGIAKVTHDLLMAGINELEAFAVFDEFLVEMLLQDQQLKPSALDALTEIFNSCGVASTHVEQDTPSTVRSRANTSDILEQEELETAKDSTDEVSEKNRVLEGANIGTPETLVCGVDHEVHDHGSFKAIKEDVTSDHEPYSTLVENPEHRPYPPLLEATPGKENTDSTTRLSPPPQNLTEDNICNALPSNLLHAFYHGFCHSKQTIQDVINLVLRDHGVSSGDDQPLCLTVEGFIEWVKSKAVDNIRTVWKAILACGYDLQFHRCTYIFPMDILEDHSNWSVAKDKALVSFVDYNCRLLSTSPSRLMPDELHVTQADLASQEYSLLQELSLLSIRSRFAFLKSVNQSIEQLLLPMADLRVSDTHSLSTASLLQMASGLMFYDTKMAFLNRTLDHSSQRDSWNASPEISLDPLETLEADKVSSSSGSQFHQAANYLSTVTSAGLRVKVASGGDPTFPLRIQLRGEQVLGSGGSFRHFMWLMARELQSHHVNVLIPCPSTAANKNKGMLILKPGPMSYTEEKLLVFFGQLLGIALRSDIPFAVDLMPVFWKSLLGLPLDAKADLQQTDVLTYNYIRRFAEVESLEEFATLCYEADLCPYRFVYTSLNGQEVELCPDGINKSVTWENHHEYVDAIRELRLQELSCESRMVAIRCGLYSAIPLHKLCVLQPSDLQKRTCGIPHVDLDFLKAHTTYVAGVKETDAHIEFFWSALESFSQDQLCKFVKFACNQERLPSTCTCQKGTPSTADVHVPPYPMKIGPPDGTGRSDARYIRVETCMFMIKLPQYSAQEITNQKLLYAINCREDPLTDI